MPFYSRTDADGRYRVSGHAGAEIVFHSRLPAGRLRLPGRQRPRIRLARAGPKFLEKNFALDKGRIVRGRVIDADTKQPVAGAAVVYQPKPGNPNNRDYDLRNTVLTDTEGRFAITALPGQGFSLSKRPTRVIFGHRSRETEPDGASLKVS